MQILKKMLPVFIQNLAFVKVGSWYKLPDDRDERKKSIELILPALAEHGFNTKPYGKSYFEPLIKDFLESFESAQENDGAVSGLLISKNSLKSDLIKALKCLRKVIEGNYPDTPKAIMRAWGFLNENY